MHDKQGFLADTAGIEAALDRAYQRAVAIGRQHGTPVWVVVDGKLVDALAEERTRALNPCENGSEI